MPSWEYSNENKNNKYVERKERKNTYAKINEVDKEGLYTLKINFMGKRMVGKANNEINVEKIIIGLKN